jgi:murein DD-endopeptidase MepM/ murein hydrolase activator NlpD
MKRKYVILCILFLFIMLFSWSFLTKVEFAPPVKGCSKNSYSQNDFLSPRDGHKHKGIDIFAKSGTPVVSSTFGIVVYTGVLSQGGNVVLIMDRQLRYHYYAHLSTIETSKFAIISLGEEIGKVGNTGNAIHTPSHLHYSIANSLKLYHYQMKGVNYTIPYINPKDLLNTYFDNQKKVK